MFQTKKSLVSIIPSRQITMMRFAAVFLVALLGLANASLEDDIHEIKALIPIDEIKELTAHYAKYDAQFQIAVAYLQGDEFRAIVDAIHETPEWQGFVAYLDAAGLNIIELIDSIRTLLGITSTTVRHSARPSTRTFHGWLNEVRNLIPFSEIRALINAKKETSSEFQEFWARLSGEEIQAVVAAVASTEEWQDLLNKGRNHGVPVDAWLGMIYNIFGWGA